ncbi:MAG: four helix bundle protein [Candidatus Magasanikbacteria bacterium]|nr:four helix bundle protein [Candidatus Magasanikbacteria bacterium]MBT4314527.1 four helix bundle protein [Candidatus Magasanikbacteria bacterium]MBT4547639.1 four helix bundle protein [Candidatus Magasanikbacteria bacterium]MBT6819308.1 four helix bundle protein [Candidatus Magasanikbacteria bacterium]
MLEKTMTPFQNKLKKLTHEYVKYTYNIVKKFPKDETYSSVSQLKRATLSIVLNYVEGYCRRRPKVRLNFYEISYGSLGESRYLYYFALDMDWIQKEEYSQAMVLAEEIGAMLWSEIEATEKFISIKSD